MIDVALKEWAVVCDLLLQGEQTLLMRKGGIAEDKGPGRFRLEASRFALFPAWLHQKPAGIKPPWRDQVSGFESEPAEVEIRGIGVATDIWQVPSRESLERIDHLLCWTSEQIDLRWNYQPSQPLYLVAVRTYRLATPKHIQNNPRYAGCKSWVHLAAADAVDDATALAVLPDAVYRIQVERVQSVFPATGSER
jgi:hypothetical protein